MDRTRYDLLTTLKQELADSCNALLKRYQELHAEYIGGTFGSHSGKYELKFHKIDPDSDLPDLPYVEPWEIEGGYVKVPTLWERQMEHLSIRYKVYLGYESEYATADLPLRWLFDPNWEDEARTQLGGESARLRAIAERDQQLQRARELAELQRLQAKYKA